MSLEGGGLWIPDHPGGTHQNGTEADFRYVRTDGLVSTDASAAFNICDPDQSHLYNRTATEKLFRLFIQNSFVELIFVAREECLGLEDSTLLAYLEPDDTGVHDNHFHLRIKDPDGPNDVVPLHCIF